MTNRTNQGTNGSAKIWGNPGDRVTGRTKDGLRWSATVAPSGRLIGKKIEAARAPAFRVFGI